MRSIALCGLLLSACVVAGCGGYWYAAPEMAGPVEQVIVIAEAPTICGSPLFLGCWLKWMRTIFIQAGLPATTEACVEKHERKHASGMNHDGRSNYRLNCGEN